MDMTGEYRIPAPRQKVWEALNNPEVLKACIPGCESLEKISDTEMSGRVAAKVGPVSAKFSGKVTLSDLDPPNGYRISGEGAGGAAGFAKGGAIVKLAEDGANGTVLSYQVDAQIGGKLAQIGSRLVDGVARKMADDFFSRFSAQVGASAAPPAPAEEQLPPAAPAPSITFGAPATDGAAAVQPPTPGIAPQPQTFAPPPPNAARLSSGRRLLPWAWVAGLVVIVIIILAIFA